MIARGMTDRIHRTVVWRRLDGLGIEHCSLVQRADGWQIQGTAIRAERNPLLVRYGVTCDATVANARGDDRDREGCRHSHPRT